MTKKELKWWHNHLLESAKSCRLAGSNGAAARELTCASAKRRIYQWDASLSVEHREAA
ncbi:MULTISPECIES: hypothetical protein [Yersinia]|uniref:Uncharacterized protein n=2 Tax=Yersinia TaxID=629 RepID=A0AAI8ZQ15_YERFR|nr:MULTISPECIES: hypothetical protein [Yersinia]CFQ96677.1 Uncharacterised protein [Yersinia frederiksenii]CNI60068.1 Uncharacterised protein [Yersinia bercovieri]CNL93939.1 Uncharacterised protein [Yersinia aleksiciae]